MSDPVDLEALQEAVDAIERTVDDHLDWIPPWRTFAQQALIEAAARALLEGRRNWYCSSDVDDLGHPPHSEECGRVVMVRVEE